MPKLPKQVIEVEYIDSGSFQGGEEDAYLAGCNDAKCVAMTRKYFDTLTSKSKVEKLRTALEAAAEYIGDESCGSLEFWRLYKAIQGKKVPY